MDREPGRRLVTRRRFLAGCLATGAAVTPLGWYAASYEPNNLEVVRRMVVIKNLPPRLDGLTAVQISDFHLRRTAEVHLRMAEKVRALQPDLVLVTGDIVDRLSAVGEALDLFRGLQPTRGIWAVPGNWDHGAEAVSSLQRVLGGAGIRFLLNDSVSLDGLWIVGVDDPASGHDRVTRALGGVPASAPRILLAHSPAIADKVRGISFDLILAGHTHGGQVNLPPINGVWLHHGPSARYVAGFYDAQGSPLYVNRGIGMTTLPVRVQARPEITHFTLRAG
jgi:predicted MPP superfamily phosphohydrolase